MAGTITNQLGIFGKTSNQDYDGSLNNDEKVMPGFIPGEDFYPLKLNNALRDATFLSYCIGEVLEANGVSYADLVANETIQYDISNSDLDQWSEKMRNAISEYVRKFAGKFAKANLADDMAELENAISFPIVGKTGNKNPDLDVPDNTASFVYTNGITPEIDFSVDNYTFDISLKDGAIKSVYKSYRVPFQPDVWRWKSHFADGSVTSAKIPSSAVTTPKIKNGEIKTANIVNLGVTTDKIKDRTISHAEGIRSRFASGAVTSDKLHDDAVVTNKFANQSVTTEHLAPLAASSEKFFNESVTTEKLDVIDFNTAKVSNNAIDSANKFANYSIPGSKISDIDVSKITGKISNADEAKALSYYDTRKITVPLLQGESTDIRKNGSDTPGSAVFPESGRWGCVVKLHNYNQHGYIQTRTAGVMLAYGQKPLNGAANKEIVCFGPLQMGEQLYTFRFYTNENGEVRLQTRCIDSKVERTPTFETPYPLWTDSPDLYYYQVKAYFTFFKLST